MGWNSKVHRRSPWLRYGVALLSVAAATAVRWGLDGLFQERSPYTTYYLAIMVSAAYGGLGPGLAATAAGGLVADLLFVAPRGRVHIGEAAEAVRFGLFLLVGGAISLISEGMHRLRRRAEWNAEGWRRSEEQFREAFDHAPVGMALTGLDGKLLYVNRAYCQVTGYAEHELLAGMTFMQLTHPEDREANLNVKDRMLSGEIPAFFFEKRYLRKDGSIVWVRASASARRDLTGRPFQIVGMVEDITARKEAEKAMRTSEERYRLINQATNDVLWDWDLSNDELVWSDAVETTFGYRRAAVPPVISWWYEHIHPDDRDRVVNAIHAMIDNPAAHAWTAEYRFRHSEGHWVDVLDRGFVARDEHGRGVRMIGSMLDLTQQRQAQQAVRESEAILRKAMSAPTVGVLFFSLNGRIHKANETLERMSGYSSDELANATHWRMLTAPEFWEPTERTATELAERGVTAPYEKQMVRKDGSRWWGLFAPTRLSGSGWNTECVEFIIDITERKQAEEALKAAKLSAEQAKAAAEAASKAKDHFLAVLSHELRTPLTPVAVAAEMLENDQRLPDDVCQDVAMIRRNVELETRLIDDLLDLTRIARGKLELDIRQVDVVAMLREAVHICRPDAEEKNLSLDVTLDACRKWVRGDAARLQQVFWNLLKNAIKFTPQGGRIAVRCCCRTEERLAIEIADTGIGIEPAALERIFDAFEQQDRMVTRQFGGLGLGLAICKAIVQMHGGSIQATSAGRHQGATFRVELPLDVAAVSPDGKPDRAEAAAEHRQASKRILLVEDHLDTARMMSRLLKLEGHEVRIAGSVAEAMDLAGGEPFDVIISDLGLPDGSGLDLMRRIQQTRPMPGIALSGYGQEEDLRRSREAGFAAHLTKPVSFDQLHAVLGRVA